MLYWQERAKRLLLQRSIAVRLIRCSASVFKLGVADGRARVLQGITLGVTGCCGTGRIGCLTAVGKKALQKTKSDMTHPPEACRADLLKKGK